MPKTPASEDKERQATIAARLAAFLEQKRAEHQAKREAKKEKRRAYGQQKPKTPERATAQFAAAVHSPFAAPVAEVPLSY
jgi:hypothetical protein